LATTPWASSPATSCPAIPKSCSKNAYIPKGEVYWGEGAYREVKPPEKIALSWSWNKDTSAGAQLHPDSPDTEVTVEFFVRGNSTEVVLTHAASGSAKDRDEHNQGWNGCFDVLTTVLANSRTS
jgi:uncharacterized protein YndB with AHSA1/START domain